MNSQAQLCHLDCDTLTIIWIKHQVVLSYSTVSCCPTTEPTTCWEWQVETWSCSVHLFIDTLCYSLLFACCLEREKKKLPLVPIKCKSKFSTPEDPAWLTQWQSCCPVSFSTIRMWLPWNKNNGNNTAQHGTLGARVNSRVRATDISTQFYLWLIVERRDLGETRFPAETEANKEDTVHADSAQSRVGWTGRDESRTAWGQCKPKKLTNAAAHQITQNQKYFELTRCLILLKSFGDDNRLNTPRSVTVGHSGVCPPIG